VSAEAWARLVDGLASAGRQLEEAGATLDPQERADGYRALLRATNNLRGRFETDPEAPELVPFNGWRQKFFMDNPDYRYWIAGISGRHEYRLTGNIGDSVYQSITAYTGRGVADASAVARIDSDGLVVDDRGGFTLTLSPDRRSSPSHLHLPAETTSVWVRFVHDRHDPVHEGDCRITRCDELDRVPVPDAAEFARDLAKLGTVLAQVPTVFEMSTARDIKSPNAVRHWSAMTGGAAFTEPGIHYLRGAWALSPGEALVVEGPPVDCRHWNIVLYSRFLNSLDYRHRPVSLTGAHAHTAGGAYRFVLAARDPGIAGYDWLDTEGRTFGVFVMRFLQPSDTPELPSVQCVPMADLRPA
jgi:hypothetical protein